MGQVSGIINSTLCQEADRVTEMLELGIAG